MSEIRANTVSNAAGTGPVTLTGQYAAKAWVNFNGTGTVAIRGSENVSSLTDQGTGTTDVNFTSSLSSGNYSVSGAANDNSYFTDTLEPLNYFTGSIRLFTYSRGGSSTGASAGTDLTFVNASIHGDLA